ncbi:hypothetical protein B0H14DRAFT_2994465, partial [Mycena olivaceomarginata]
MRPSFTLLALTLAAGVGATSLMSGGHDTPRSLTYPHYEPRSGTLAALVRISKFAHSQQPLAHGAAREDPRPAQAQCAPM